MDSHTSFHKDCDCISADRIKKYLKSDIEIMVLDTTDSTNKVCQSLADNGAPHGSCVLARSQTAGRGRLGRSFYSPKGSGIYMSILIKPDFNLSESVLITAAASVAVARAIEEVAGCSPHIKWVNDIYINEKKVCGILTQAKSDISSGQIKNIIVGIGINCTTESFPEELSEIAGIVPGTYSKNQLAAAVIDHFLSICSTIKDRQFMDYYISHSMVIGKPINVIPKDKTPRPAFAEGIDADGGLIVTYDDGSRQTLTTGEISIRIIH